MNETTSVAKMERYNISNGGFYRADNTLHQYDNIRVFASTAPVVTKLEGDAAKSAADLAELNPTNQLVSFKVEFSGPAFIFARSKGQKVPTVTAFTSLTVYAVDDKIESQPSETFDATAIKLLFPSCPESVPTVSVESTPDIKKATMMLVMAMLHTIATAKDAASDRNAAVHEKYGKNVEIVEHDDDTKDCVLIRSAQFTNGESAMVIGESLEIYDKLVVYFEPGNEPKVTPVSDNVAQGVADDTDGEFKPVAAVKFTDSIHIDRAIAGDGDPGMAMGDFTILVTAGTLMRLRKAWMLRAPAENFGYTHFDAERPDTPRKDEVLGEQVGEPVQF